MTDTNERRPPVAQTLTFLFDNNPTWGDLIWFAEQVKAANVDLGQEILFEYEDDPNDIPVPIGISLISHPDPSQFL